MSYFLFLDDNREVKDAQIFPPKGQSRRILIGNRLSEVTGIPDGCWEIVRSFEEFAAIIRKRGIPLVASFDHDLDKSAVEHYISLVKNGKSEINYSKIKEKTGYHCAQFLLDEIKKTGYNSELKVYVHSANEFGAHNIKKLLKDYLQHD